jgi:hypothetical protein
VPEGREPIPDELKRALFIEAGYRCAISTCRAVAPLTIEHIEEWAKVKEHKFANMIVLCANCHGLKGNRPPKLDRKALRQIKANLGIINGRYGELERRLLMLLTKYPQPSTGDTFEIKLPGGLDLLLWYLIEDGILVPQQEATQSSGQEVTRVLLDNNPLRQQDYLVTETGWDLIAQLRDAQPVPL